MLLRHQNVQFVHDVSTEHDLLAPASKILLLTALLKTIPVFTYYTKIHDDK